MGYEAGRLEIIPVLYLMYINFQEKLKKKMKIITVL